MEEKVKTYLQNKKPRLTVISTVNKDGKPESALMTYAVLEGEALTLILSTRLNTRKWANLKTNKHVSLVFGGGFSDAEVQFEGEAELFEDAASYKILEDVYFEQNPETLQFRGIPELVFLKVKPTWIRFTDYGMNPPVIEEKNF